MRGVGIGGGGGGTGRVQTIVIVVLTKLSFPFIERIYVYVQCIQIQTKKIIYTDPDRFTEI